MRILQIIFFFLIFDTNLLGQYTVTTFVENYNELTKAEQIPLEDDWFFTNYLIPLDFEFNLGNQVVNHVELEGPNASFYYTQESVFNYFGYFVGLQNGIFTGEESSINYIVEEVNDSFILKIEYKNCAFYKEYEAEGSSNNRVNFQIWIYEYDSSIEFRFGSSTIPNPELAYNLLGPQIGIFLGLNDIDQTLESAIFLTGNPTAPNIWTNTDLNIAQNASLNGTPADGRVYRFAPNSLSVESDDKESFSVYPTLATEELRIKGVKENNLIYTITNLAGQLIETGILNEDRVDISSLSNSMYLIAIGDSSQKFIKK